MSLLHNAYHLASLGRAAGAFVDRLSAAAETLDILDRLGVLAWLHNSMEHLATWLSHLPAMLA